MMMMPEEAVAIHEKIPDDKDIQRQNDENDRRVLRMHGRLARPAPYQLEDFNGNEERGLTNGQPTGPTQSV